MLEKNFQKFLDGGSFILNHEVTKNDSVVCVFLNDLSFLLPCPCAGFNEGKGGKSDLYMVGFRTLAIQINILWSKHRTEVRTIFLKLRLLNQAVTCDISVSTDCYLIFRELITSEIYM